MDIKTSQDTLNHQHKDNNSNSDDEHRSVLESLLTSHNYTYDDTNSTDDDDPSSILEEIESSSYINDDPEAARDPLEIQSSHKSPPSKATKKKVSKYYGYDDLYSNKMFNPFKIKEARIQPNPNIPPKLLNASQIHKRKILDLKSRILQKRKSLLANQDEKESNGINIMSASTITEAEFAKKPRILTSQSISKQKFFNIREGKPKPAYLVNSMKDDDIPIVPYSPSSSIKDFNDGISIKHVKSTNKIQKIYRVIPKPKSSSPMPQPSTSSYKKVKRPSQPLFEVKLKTQEISDDEDLDAQVANFDKNGCRLKNPIQIQEKFTCDTCKQSFSYKVSLLVHQKNNQCSNDM